MRLPETVDPDILEVYRERVHGGAVAKLQGQGIVGAVRSEDLSWDSAHLPTLAELCVRVLASSWEVHPVSELPLERDTRTLLGALPCPVPPLPLPLALLVEHVHHDSFWSRAYRSRWGPVSPSGTQRSPLQLYLERHCSELLSTLRPADYEPEQISELVEMCRDWVKKLEVRGLVAGEVMPAGRTGAGEGGPSYRDMIPLGGVLSGLSDLTEVHLSLGLRADTYSRDLHRLAPVHLRRLSAGLSRCPHLTVLRITCSDIDCDKLKTVLEGLSEARALRVLDLSHCNVAERGALQLAAFLLRQPSCRELLLTNNHIGPQGAEGLAYALCQPVTRLLALDLRCNSRLGDTGVTHILMALLRGTLLQKLNISACGVGMGTGGGGAEVGRLVAAALAAGRTPLRELDISVNNLGPESGAALLAALEARGSGGPAVLCARAARLGRWEGALARATLRTAARRRAARARFHTGASRLLQANRVARAIGIGEVDPLQLARQLTARPSAASLPLSLTLSLSLSQDLLDEMPHPVEPETLHFEIPPLKNPLPTSGTSPDVTSRRSSYHGEIKECKRTGAGRRGSVDSALGGAAAAVEAGGRPLERAPTNVSIHLSTSAHSRDGRSRGPV